jgi:hypothetical protein
MVRQLTRRLLGGGAVAIAVTVLSAVLSFAALSVAGLSIAGAAAAYAAGPNAITISGPGIAEVLTVRASERPDQFAALLGEVNWLSSRPSLTRSPDAGKLGSQYVLILFTGDKPTRRFEVYPLAAGGPRVFRPANQPDKHRTTAGWFYGRLSVPDTLRNAGVPLPGTMSTVTNGGIGGGEVAEKPFDPNSDLTSLLTQWRQFLLLNGAVVVVIALGLAGTSLLVRRRVDRLYRRAAEQARAQNQQGRAAVQQGRAAPVRRR